MQNILTLPLRQDSFSESKNHEKINNSVSYGTIVLSKELQELNVPSLEEMSVSKAKEALMLVTKVISPKEALQILKNLEVRKEAIRIFEERKKSKEALEQVIEQLPANIKETPKFHEAKSAPVELSQSARDTFARIGERAAAKSLNEQVEEASVHFKQTFAKQQTRRAKKYNIPFDASSVDYHQLSRKIDGYGFLLDEAKRWDICWDIKVYDPAALEQEIEEARSRYWGETSAMRSDYYSSVRVAV